MNDLTIEVEGGAGGVDAIAWAGMLTCMYLAWALKRDHTARAEWDGARNCGWVACTVPDELREALRDETGVHRLIRDSPFDLNHRRQTAFASVRVDDVLFVGPDGEVRTYVLDPYKQVKNERDGSVRSDVEAILAGDLDALFAAGDAGRTTP